MMPKATPPIEIDISHAGIARDCWERYLLAPRKMQAALISCLSRGKVTTPFFAPKNMGFYWPWSAQTIAELVCKQVIYGIFGLYGIIGDV